MSVLNIFETRNLMQGFGKNDGSFFKSFKVEEHVASIIVRGPGNIMRGQSSLEYSLSAKRSNGWAQTASNNDRFEHYNVLIIQNLTVFSQEICLNMLL